MNPDNTTVRLIHICDNCFLLEFNRQKGHMITNTAAFSMCLDLQANGFNFENNWIEEYEKDNEDNFNYELLKDKNNFSKTRKVS